MELLQFFRPKNFQVSLAYKGTEELIPVYKLQPGEHGQTEYYFGGRLYKHIGEWPPERSLPTFKVPIVQAKLDNHDVTEELKKLQGPTKTELSMDVYVPRPHVQFSITRVGIRFSLGIKWVLKKKMTGLLKVIDLFGKESHHMVV
jgi:hypothetical protein